jgi:hypothetical protein
MNCQKCQKPLIACCCQGAVDRIEAYLAANKGKIPKSEYNALVNRAVELLEPVIDKNEREFFSRHPDLKRWPPRRRFVLPGKGKKK